MKPLVSSLVISLCFAVAAPAASAATISYTAATNTWVYSGFSLSPTEGGLGELGGDGGTVVGGGSHMLWNEINIGGGAGTYNFSTYTDFYFPAGFQVKVTGAKWTNLEVRDIDRGEGIFGYQHLNDAQLSGAQIADGTILNGIFTLGFAGNGARWTYVSLDPVSDIPEPATLALLGLGMLGMGLRRRRDEPCPADSASRC